MQFESENIYLQWLYRRHAMPMRINNVMVKYLWIIAVIFLSVLSADPLLPPFNEMIVMVTGAATFIIPLVFMFLYCLYFAPLAVETDLRSSLMSFLFMSLVPTGEIVTNLRRYILIRILAVTAPAVFALMGSWVREMIFYHYFNTFVTGLLDFLILTAMFSMLCWFLLETGIVSAGLPKFLYSSGLIFLLWVIPVLIGIFEGGYYLAEWHSDFWYHYRLLLSQNSQYGTYTYNLTRNLTRLSNTDFWAPLHYAVLLSIAALITRRYSNRFMARKRVGYW